MPLDFRLGFGGSFGEETKIVSLDVAPNRLDREPRSPSVELVGDIAATLRGAARGRRAGAEPGAHRRAGSASCARPRPRSARPSASELDDDRAPLHPMRVYRELAEVLDRDAIVIGDGGDFVSYAGRVIETYEPGCWMDPGPFGCLGAGPGQAIGAKVAHPDRQVCLLLGDGAFGFSGLEFDTMVRHGLPRRRRDGQQRDLGARAPPDEVPLRLLGRRRAAPETRYDQVVEALGCHGELVREPAELRPALERAFESGRPALVNVLTDPEVVYPRKAVLA